MTDHPEAENQTPSESPQPAAPLGGGPSGDRPELLHLQDVVRMIEDAKQVSFTSDEALRQKFLKQLKRGEFPAPAKPADRLPRVERGGDIDWSECWWNREDIAEWIRGETPNEKWESRWEQYRVKKWRDLPSLASYMARRVVKGEGEWEHWSDHYHARAFTGSILRFVVWAAFWGWLCFMVLPVLNEPLVEKNKTGNVVHEDRIYVLKDGREVYVDLNPSVADSGIKYRVITAEGELGDEVPKSEIATFIDEEGNEQLQKAAKYRYKKVKDKDTGVEQYVFETTGKPIEDTNIIGTPYKMRALAKKEHSFFSFLSADLSESTGIPGASVPLAIFLILVGIPALVTVYKFMYFRMSMSYTLTDSRLIVRQGLLSRHESQVRVIQIQDLSVHQGLFNVMFGVGDIIVHSDDVDTPELEIKGIRDPRAVKDRMFMVSEAAKSEKRYYIESTGGSNRPAAPPR